MEASTVLEIVRVLRAPGLWYLAVTAMAGLAMWTQGTAQHWPLPHYLVGGTWLCATIGFLPVWIAVSIGGFLIGSSTQSRPQMPAQRARLKHPVAGADPAALEKGDGHATTRPVSGQSSVI